MTPKFNRVIRMALATLSMATSTQAYAGRLEDGFQGHPFGKLEKMPLDNCVSEETSNAKQKVFSCRFSLGEVKDITYSPLIYADIYYGYVLRTKVVDQCIRLKATLDEAWFQSVPVRDDSFYQPHERQHAWVGSGVTGVWQYNITLAECTVYVGSSEQRAKVDAIKKQEIADAAKSGI